VLAWKISELFEQNDQKVKLILMDTLCPNATQQATSLEYREMLQQLVDDLREPLALSNSLVLPEMPSITTHEDQIRIIFRALLQFNQNKSTQLQLIAALLLANQRYVPKSISTAPHIFVCKETQRKARAFQHDVDDMSYAAALGWSSIITSVALTILPSMTTHFDFVTNNAVMLEIVKYLKNILPSEKTPMCNQTHNLCNNEPPINELQKRLLSLMQLLSTIPPDQQSSVFANTLPDCNEGKTSTPSSGGHFSLYSPPLTNNNKQNTHSYDHYG